MTADRPPSHRSGARRRAVAIAGHEGDLTTAETALTDDDPAVRATGLGALARLGGVSRDHVRSALADPDPGVRRRALTVAAELDGDVELDLVPLLSDPDDTVVEVAAWALGEREPFDPLAGAALQEIVASHPDALCREAAVASLGAIGDAAALPTILAATKDIATVRRRAVIALAPFDGPEVDAALDAAKDDRDWQVRQAAEDLLAD
jgi:HEAT repeat protein